MTRKRIQFVISLLITLFFLYLAFRNVTWDALWRGLRQVNYLWAIPFMAITVLSMYFRTVRWKYLLEPVVNAPPRKFFPPLIICFALNSILPGRVGEFARAYLVSRDHRVRFTSTLATVIVERIADGLGLLVLFVAILAFVPLGAGISKTWDARNAIPGAVLIHWITVGLIALALASVGAAVLVRRAAARSTGESAPAGGLTALAKQVGGPRRVANVLDALAVVCAAAAAIIGLDLLLDPWQVYTFGNKIVIDAEKLRQLSNKLLIVCVILLAGSLLMLWSPFRRLVQAVIAGVPLIPKALKEGLNRFIDTFTEGFHSLRNPRIIFWVIFHTGTVWLTVGLSLVIMAQGFPEVSLDLVEGMAVSIIICIAILIPAAPGYWGLYEVGCILGLQMLGVVELGPEGQATALSFSLVVHFLQIVPILTPGLFFMWRRQVGLAELARVEELESTKDSDGRLTDELGTTKDENA